MITYKSLHRMNAPHLTHRGFALLISVILSSVILSVGLALADVAYKQVVLASTERQSEYAFYAADSGLECALYWDQKQDEFDYTSEPTSGSFTCQGSTVNFTTSTYLTNRTTTFSIPCAAGGSQATVEVYKQSTGATSIYANGFNDCNASDLQRIERGEKLSY